MQLDALSMRPFRGHKLGRDPRHRLAMLKNLANALIKHERIVTTMAKGKELRRVGDKVSALVLDYFLVSMRGY